MIFWRGVVCVWAVQVILFIGWGFYFGCFFFICTDWSWLDLKFSRVQVLQLFLEFRPIIWFKPDQFLHESSISVILIDCIHPPYNRGVTVFAHVGTYYLPSFQKRHILLVFHFKYLFFFFVGIARSCISRVILSAIHTFRFHQAIFLHMVRVLFTAFGTCVSSSIGFSVVSILLAFEAPQWSWDVLFNLFYTIAYLHLLENVGVEYYFSFSFSNEDSFYVYEPLFSQGSRHLFSRC